MAGTGDPQNGCERLADLIRLQAAERECSARAETVVRAAVLRTRLGDIGVSVTRDTAAVLMAAAMVLASGSDEWDGDYRDALAEVASVGLELFDA